jgi:hypothetical protein
MEVELSLKRGLVNSLGVLRVMRSDILAFHMRAFVAVCAVGDYRCWGPSVGLSLRCKLRN